MRRKRTTRGFRLGIAGAGCSNQSMRVLIVGCGYVGLPLGAELARLGHEVFGVTRSAERGAELQARGLTPLTADVTRPGDLARLPQGLDWVVNTVSSNKGG